MIRAECACGAKYKMPDQSAGKRARCKKCGGAFVVPRSDAAVDPEQNLADLAAVSAAAEPSMKLTPLADESLRAATAALGGRSLDSVPGVDAKPTASMATFVKQAGWSFAFLADVGSLITFVVVSLALSAGVLVQFGGCFGGAATLLIFGWFYSYLLNTLGKATAGESGVGDLMLTDGFWEGVFSPLLKFLASWLLALTPFICAVIYLVALQQIDATMCVLQIVAAMMVDFELVLDPQVGGGPLQFGMLVAGLAVWPMLLLAVAVGGFGDLLRVDLAALSAVQTLPAFMVTLVLFLLLWMGPPLALLALMPEEDRSGPGAGMLTEGKLVQAAIAAVLSGYAATVSMRILGLYYFHFKRRFAFDWG